MAGVTRPLRIVDTPRRPGDDRTDFQHDRDIILYSTALRRLSGITQVVSAETGHVFHNRLTHSLQVAQVGRRLAEKLHIKQGELAKHYEINADAVEAACLAHDLGHPPFGHLAESELNKRAGDVIEGFEGNAQSFRIIAELAFRSGAYNGLNLTYQTLRGVLKYPWTYPRRPADKQNKWGAYSSEIAAFKHATLNETGGPVERAAESELMDWADDLTYAIHDVEDFYRAGLIPLHLLRPLQKGSAPLAERNRFLEYVWSRRNSVPELAGISQTDLDDFGEVIFTYFNLEAPYEGTKKDRAGLRTFTSQLVSRYINGLTLAEPSAKRTVIRDQGRDKEIAVLKQLTWFYVIEAPGLAVQQHAQRQIIKYLFHTFMHETNTKPSHLLPPYYRERLEDIVRAHGAGTVNNRRVVADLIAGMTESQAYAVYQRLNGIVSGSALDRVLV